MAPVRVAPTTIADLGPRASTQRPTNGPVRPLTSNETEKPSVTCVRDHPNSVSSGSMYNPNDQKETPLPNAMATTEPASIHQP